MAWTPSPSDPRRTADPPRIRLLLADDHTLFRHGLKRLLEAEDDIEVVGEAHDGAEAVRKAAALRPDLAVLDIGMPGLLAFEAARQIRHERPRTRVLFLSMYEDEDYVVQANQAGAAGYVLKDTPASELVAAIRAIHQGGRYLSPRVVSTLLARPARPEPARRPPHLESLTRRERETMKLLAEGMSVKAIAAQLGLSIKTVDTHKLNLMRKLGVHNKAQLVQCAVRNNVIKLG